MVVVLYNVVEPGTGESKLQLQTKYKKIESDEQKRAVVKKEGKKTELSNLLKEGSGFEGGFWYLGTNDGAYFLVENDEKGVILTFSLNLKELVNQRVRGAQGRTDSCSLEFELAAGEKKEVFIDIEDFWQQNSYKFSFSYSQKPA